MFGEQSMYGQSMVHFDSKKRIVLPKFTYIEPKESLLIIDNEEYLTVYNEELFERKIKYLENQYVNSNVTKKREIDLELLKYFSSVLKKVQSDTVHRINLCGIQTDKEQFLCIGARDHVILNTKIVK